MAVARCGSAPPLSHTPPAALPDCLLVIGSGRWKLLCISGRSQPLVFSDGDPHIYPIVQTCNWQEETCNYPGAADMRDGWDERDGEEGG